MMKALLLAGAFAIGPSLSAIAQDVPPSARNEQNREQQADVRLGQVHQQTGRSLNRVQLTAGEIRQIQQRLYDLGYPVGDVDGIWGPVTENALLEFQRTRNLEGQPQATLDALGR